ncbi:MAG: tRNA (adenosine(37)-N6)-threonylcarbamoyltransferase complex dimerization subunit type 1 TsaB [Paludibacteraceae bacterium]|nr:tRNA (adenosine(37)-N6)-threonylcarbamoyltransferase complex dimerization subunit type 1 TsaB [Paludibacteraceae bacterium]
MTVLAIETSTSVCSAAWCIDGQCMAERIRTEGGNHSAILPVFIDELLTLARENGWYADAVAVSEGPGSYTGLRIGYSTAKGLCYGWNIPLIPVPSLDILCQVASDRLPQPCMMVPMLDARRMEVYTRSYQWDGHSFTPVDDVHAQIVADSTCLPKHSPVCYFGDGAGKCANILENDNCHILPDIIPHAAVIGSLVEKYTYPVIQGKDLAYCTPFYLKDFIAAPSHVKGLQ